MAAALRLPKSMPSHEKEAAVEALINRLGLAKSAGTPVGETPPQWMSSMFQMASPDCVVWRHRPCAVRRDFALHLREQGHDRRGCKEEGIEWRREEAPEHCMRAAGQSHAAVPG